MSERMGHENLGGGAEYSTLINQMGFEMAPELVLLSERANTDLTESEKLNLLSEFTDLAQATEAAQVGPDHRLSALGVLLALTELRVKLGLIESAREYSNDVLNAAYHYMLAGVVSKELYEQLDALLIEI